MTAKEKLIASAIQVFARHGYTGGKIADIVKGADANIAAVNYHFRSKENLFAHVLRSAFAIAEQTYPIDGGLDASAPVEQRLKAFSRAILMRSFDDGPAGDFNRIMSKTVHASNSPINTICEEIRSLEVEPLQALLLAFLGEVDQMTLSIATLNFLSQSSVISKHPFVVEKIFGPQPSQEVINQYIEQQVEVVFAATATLRQSAAVVLPHC